MVFLTMDPTEIEHVKEPVYDPDAYWTPSFQLQRFLDMTPRSDSSETSDASSSQEESDSPNFVSSRSTSPPGEREIPPLHSQVKEAVKSTTVNPAITVKEVEVSQEGKPDVTRTPPTYVPPLVAFGHWIPLAAPVEHSSSEDILAGQDGGAQGNQLPSLETTLLGEFKSIC
jgi:hypothetical protein